MAGTDPGKAHLGSRGLPQGKEMKGNEEVSSYCLPTIGHSVHSFSVAAWGVGRIGLVLYPYIERYLPGIWNKLIK